MQKKSHINASDIRGVGRLAVDATLGLTRLVEVMHHNILRHPGILGRATQRPAGGITGLVYKTIRGVTRLVGGGVDAALGQLAKLAGADGSSAQREALLAALNGVLGDHLQANANPLAISMKLRRDGQPLALTRTALRAAIPDPSGKILLLVHGLCMSDLQWRRHGHDHGAALAADCGFTPLYLHYNSGLHISSNGREFAELIDDLLRAWPVPVAELAILAHSMGGLVTRSACWHAQRARHAWLQHLRNIVFLGTPHHGAPLERGGNWVDRVLDASPYTTAFARLGKMRSAGITDLRHGSMVESDWRRVDGRRADRFAGSRRKPALVSLPDNVACHVLAASIGKKTGEPMKALLGDGLVPLDSALGRSANAKRQLAIPPRRQWIGYAMNHLDLLDRKNVYARIRRCLV